jgi:predicted amidophosphoribosyltransferase
MSLLPYSKEGYPQYCSKCGSGLIKSHTCNRAGWQVSEMEYICNDCGRRVSYWAYGQFDPFYSNATQLYRLPVSLFKHLLWKLEQRLCNLRKG